MNNIERDKFLTEAMGECWHQWCTKSSFSGFCDKCQTQIVDKTQNDFSTWEGFGKLWEWAQKQDGWRDFIAYEFGWGDFSIIDPDKFANAVYKFLKNKK